MPVQKTHRVYFLNTNYCFIRSKDDEALYNFNILDIIRYGKNYKCYPSYY